MKKLTIVILFFTNFAQAQFAINNIPNRTTTLGAFGNLYVEGINTGIEGGLLFKKHWLNLGVAINPTYYSGTSFQNWALNVNYNYLPNSYNNRFDLLFDFNYTLGLRHNSASVYDQDGNLISKTGLLPINDFNLGMGFNTNLSQRFYLKTTFGLGVAYSVGLTSSRWYWTGNARISVGYRFSK